MLTHYNNLKNDYIISSLDVINHSLVIYCCYVLNLFSVLSKNLLLFKYSPGGEYSTILIVVVVCEHGVSPALKDPEVSRSSLPHPLLPRSSVMFIRRHFLHRLHIGLHFELRSIFWGRSRQLLYENLRGI